MDSSSFLDFVLFDEIKSQPNEILRNTSVLNAKSPVLNNNLVCSVSYDANSLAKRIANVDDLVLQIKTLKNVIVNLEKQLLDLSTSSSTVQQMYNEEKSRTEKLTENCEKYAEELKQVKNNLANKSLKYDQILHLQSKESLKPVKYNELCIRYLKLHKMLESNTYKPKCEALFKEKICSYISVVSNDDNFVKRSIKKHKLLENDEKPKEVLTKCKKSPLKIIENIKISSNNEEDINCGNSVMKKNTISQGTQYISTTTTRGTCTSNFIKKHNVGTNFPEILPISIEEILKEMILTIRPISPIKEEIFETAPTYISKITSESKSTNTDLRNVRMHIDYVTTSSLINIKKSDSRPPSRIMYDNVKIEQASCLENAFNQFGNEMYSIADLWNLLGQTIFSMIRNGNTQINQTQIDLLNERMEILNEKLQKEEIEREVRCFANIDPKYDFCNNSISNEKFIGNYFSSSEMNEYETTILNSHPTGEKVKDLEHTKKFSSSEVLQNSSPKLILNNMFSSIISNQLANKVDIQNNPVKVVAESCLQEPVNNTSNSKSKYSGLENNKKQERSTSSSESELNYNTSFQNVNNTDNDNFNQLYELGFAATKLHSQCTEQNTNKTKNIEDLSCLGDLSSLDSQTKNFNSNPMVSAIVPKVNTNEEVGQISTVICQETLDFREKFEKISHSTNVDDITKSTEMETKESTQSTNMIIEETKETENKVNRQQNLGLIANLKANTGSVTTNIMDENQNTTSSTVNPNNNSNLDVIVPDSNATSIASINLNIGTPITINALETLKCRDEHDLTRNYDSEEQNKTQSECHKNTNLTRDISHKPYNEEINSLEPEFLNKSCVQRKDDQISNIVKVSPTTILECSGMASPSLRSKLGECNHNQIALFDEETTKKHIKFNSDKHLVGNSANAVDLILELFKNQIKEPSKLKSKVKKPLKLAVLKKPNVKQKKKLFVRKTTNGITLQKRNQRSLDQTTQTKPKIRNKNINSSSWTQEKQLNNITSCNNYSDKRNGLFENVNTDKKASSITAGNLDNISCDNITNNIVENLTENIDFTSHSDKPKLLENTNELTDCSIILNNSQEEKLFNSLDSNELHLIQSSSNLLATSQISENVVEDIFGSLSDISCSPPIEDQFDKNVKRDIDGNQTDVTNMSRNTILGNHKQNFKPSLSLSSSYTILETSGSESFSQDSDSTLDEDCPLFRNDMDNDDKQKKEMNSLGNQLEIQNCNKRSRKTIECFGSSDEEDFPNPKEYKIANEINPIDLKTLPSVTYNSGLDSDFLIYESDNDSIHSTCGKLKIIIEPEEESTDTEISLQDEESIIPETSNDFTKYISPSSPSPEANEIYAIETKIIPLDRSKTTLRFNSIINRLINNYDSKNRAKVCQRRTGKKNDHLIVTKCQAIIENYLNSVASNVQLLECVHDLISQTQMYKLISLAIIENAKVVSSIATKEYPIIPWMTKTHHKIIVLIHRLQLHFKQLCSFTLKTIEENLFGFKADSIPLEILMNLTQLYVSIIDTTANVGNPARLFIFKCLYFHKVKAIPMIYQILLAYPHVLPINGDPYYDRSDSLINTIQCILTNIIYNVDQADLKHKHFLNLIRYRYKYENFKPTKLEVIENLLLKIRAGKYKNVAYSLALLCKRQDQNWIEKMILTPLINLIGIYGNEVNNTDANDLSIECILDCISFIIKPFPLETDVSQYLSIYNKFLSAGTGRSIIEEAAVCSIIRTARFGYVNAFNLICHYSPTYNLQPKTKAIIKSFVYKKNVTYLNLLAQQFNELNNT